MVQLKFLDDFTVYRVKTPVIMPETAKLPKKGQAYIVLAPTMEQGVQFLDSSKVFRCRYLSKYYIPRRWTIQLQAKGQQILKFNGDGEITAMLAKNKSGNLKDVDGVTQFNPNGTMDPLKRLNVYIEMNYVFETILSNEKDRRKANIKSQVLIQELLKEIGRIKDLGDYETTIIIPMNLWFTQEDYVNPEYLYRPISPNCMGHILNALTNVSTLKSFGTVVLADGNLFVKLNADGIPEKDADDASGFIRGVYKTYMTKLKNRRNIGDGDDDVEDPDDEDDASASSLVKAEAKTKEVLAVEQIEKIAKIDSSSLSQEQAKKVAAVAKKVVAKSNAQKTAAAPKSSKNQPPIVAPQEETEEVVADTATLSPEDVDVLMTAQMEGRSVQSQKRNEMLKKKYSELKIGDKPIKELIEEEGATEIPDVPVLANTINPSLTHIKGQRFEEVYEKTLMQHDVVSILMHFSGVKPAMYLNKNIKIDDVSTRTDRVLKYTVEFEDENRKRHHFAFRLPKMYKHKYLFLNGQELVITHQKFPFPITKVSADRCQLVTNYNKVFVYRYGTALSPRMTKLKKILSGGTLKNVSIRKGDCTKLNGSRLTTIEFDELAAAFVSIEIGKAGDSVLFAFDPDILAASIGTAKTPEIEGEDSDKLVPLGYRRKGNSRTAYWLSGVTNKVYDPSGTEHGELSDFMVDTLIQYNPAAEKELADTSAGTKFIYSRARIMSQDIPLILVMGASDPNGLVGALEKGNISYQFVDKRPTVDKSTTGVIPFADGYLVFDRYPYENSLLLNGLSTFPTKEYGFYDLNTRDTYVEIFGDMCGQRTLADNLAAFNYMMVDPITKSVLTKLGMPTDFVTLLYYCNGVLADNSYQIDSNYQNTRLRSTEIIMAHLYRELAVAWGNYRSGRTDTFSIPENAIITLLLTSKIIDPKSKLNISLELESDRNVKLKGPSGMNEDHSFTIEKRAYHPSMRGIVATNSTPSGEVGINRHLVINPNILDARGFISIERQGEYDGTELLSPGEALSPFGAESADIERLCMSISQAKHLVPVASQCSCPISYDFERVAPYLSNDFAFQAKQDGKVIEISEDLMVIQYADGSYDDIDLSVHPAKNTDGGFFIMNSMSTNLKVGAKFKAGQILAFDKKYINDLDFFGDPCANVGTLARVAFESNGSVYEDSGYITDEFAHRFATKITRQKRVIISEFANIKYIAKIGQKVQANDPILAFDDTEDEFSSQLLASITDQMEDLDEVIATSAPVVSKYSGVIKDIGITYTVPLERMSPTLRKVVQEYSKDAAKREKVLGKYRDVRDANTIVKNSEMSVPDSRGKVGGVKIGDGVIIDFYIEYEDVAGNGDKGSIGALKFTTCNVIPTELAGYTENNEERKIDVYVASFGAFKRMVADVEKIGILTKVLVEEKLRMKRQYGARVKEELKKYKGKPKG
ncbi:MAG: hypothetical protein NC311_05665 [Muribaculaceae bacterium]|nr:hypothetical protein [Muribaculaceae bacterium]